MQRLVRQRALQSRCFVQGPPLCVVRDFAAALDLDLSCHQSSGLNKRCRQFDALPSAKTAARKIGIVVHQYAVIILVEKIVTVRNRSRRQGT